MSQKTAAGEKEVQLAELRDDVLNNVLTLIESEPPLGERYETLLEALILQAYNEAKGKLSPAKKKAFLAEVFAHVASYGPIEEYFSDEMISEIMVNGPNQVFIEKQGELIPVAINYENNRHVRFAISHILNPLGRYISHKFPLVDSHLPDGSRVNAVIPPVSAQGPCITIRRFLKDKLTTDDLIKLGSMTEAIAEILAICVKARLNIVVAGNTSSGKTTLLNILAKSIPDHERIVSIEDALELQLQQTHKISLEAKPPDYKGEGQVTIRDLVRNALRMRPDRIIVGEVRGGEALDMLQAMNTGHDGSMTTVHSNSPRDTLSRIETVALMAGIEIPIFAIRKQIAAAVDLIVYLNRFPDGTRKVTQISEIVGMESEIITMQDLFVFRQSGIGEKGEPLGEFRSTGLRPMFSEQLEAMGHKLNKQLFFR